MGWGRCVVGCLLCTLLGTAHAATTGASETDSAQHPSNLDGADLYAISASYTRATRPTPAAAAPRSTLYSTRAPLIPDLDARFSTIGATPEIITRPRHGLIDVFGWEDDHLVQAATYRSSGPVYFKGKAGYLAVGDNWDASDDFSIGRFVEDFNDSGAVGLGAGYKLSNGERFEIEYVVNKKDVQVFSIGYTF